MAVTCVSLLPSIDCLLCLLYVTLSVFLQSISIYLVDVQKREYCLEREDEETCRCAESSVHIERAKPLVEEETPFLKHMNA